MKIKLCNIFQTANAMTFVRIILENSHYDVASEKFDRHIDGT